MGSKIVTLSFLFVAAFAGYSYAESTVTTIKGTFRCETACVVTADGSVTDAAGGTVWKKVAPQAPKETKTK
ncbi:hypothetical protein KDN34_14315 [Shewanella yunxiaonensis]|uniref:Periplasmic protein n=1 Tax=Shewanella yunxiaonensis TaxID=2829809 RepID=A0ABX7YRJ8_9GAMM|nr:hypothetical protein [Shewanella yunxiaonensis]QUN05357.1 hypothetical protein KDN34_14315 [Shewanella yunxiaonensis]